ncbi:hypothetical protein LGM90_08130 [Burkholderia sp. AU28942]|uniref:hypothetical protein n=1 Tax=Burkholderia TaxID=32008 RepID=UPI001186313F|nr:MULTISPECIES: hypothetical protein [Burkholderia]MBY4697779.1 hypothetical protein [Burkholderia latens]MCA8308471.1 hypothetical protein [Burkholderia sp. AU28942]QTO50047.1 hypothetical protein J8I86_21045 [Burkholderia latens]
MPDPLVRFAVVIRLGAHRLHGRVEIQMRKRVDRRRRRVVEGHGHGIAVAADGGNRPRAFPPRACFSGHAK